MTSPITTNILSWERDASSYPQQLNKLMITVTIIFTCDSQL